jgi:hypothetical protein
MLFLVRSYTFALRAEETIAYTGIANKQRFSVWRIFRENFAVIHLVYKSPAFTSSKVLSCSKTFSFEYDQSIPVHLFVTCPARFLLSTATFHH